MLRIFFASSLKLFGRQAEINASRAVSLTTPSKITAYGMLLGLLLSGLYSNHSCRSGSPEAAVILKYLMAFPL